MHVVRIRMNHCGPKTIVAADNNRSEFIVIIVLCLYFIHAHAESPLDGCHENFFVISLRRFKFRVLTEAFNVAGTLDNVFPITLMSPSTVSRH